MKRTTIDEIEKQNISKKEQAVTGQSEVSYPHQHTHTHKQDDPLPLISYGDAGITGSGSLCSVSVRLHEGKR